MPINNTRTFCYAYAISQEAQLSHRKKTAQGTSFDLFFSEIGHWTSFILAESLDYTPNNNLRYRYTFPQKSWYASTDSQEDQNQRTVETHLSPAKIGISPR